MRHLQVLTIALTAGLAMSGAASILAASDGTAPNAPAHMQWSYDGPILVTPDGMTLYTTGADAITPGKSACSNIPAKTYREEQAGMGPAPLIGANIHKACAQKWPPYMADEHAQPVGDFAMIARPEGGRQWTYRGFPLYRSIRDHKPGDRLGIAGGGFGAFGRGFRLAMVNQDLPAGLKFTRRDEGLVFIAANDKPVYTPSGMRMSRACVGCDSELFQPILAPALARVTGDWSIVDAGAGRRQFAFKGKPLYTAPDSMKEWEIAEAGGWEMVLYRKGPGMPSEIGKHLALIGDVYTDKAGHTLYSFNCTSPAQDGVRCDDPGDPAGYWVALCGDAQECARRWHPYIASPGARPVGDWSVVEVAYPMFTTNPGVTYPPEAPRVKAWAFRGTPVYTYYEDKEPGETWGDGVKWIGGSSFTAMRVPGHSIFE
jgi:predicted lipoprotein with Yx(FWY)xxD motif